MVGGAAPVDQSSTGAAAPFLCNKTEFCDTLYSFDKELRRKQNKISSGIGWSTRLNVKVLLGLF